VKVSDSPLFALEANIILRCLKARFPECAAWQIHMNGTKDFQSPEGIGKQR
jgi:hypothetical protein